MTTLKEFKQDVYSFIEEYDKSAKELTKDVDIIAKINAIINTKILEVTRYKKIEAKETLDVIENEEYELSDIDSNAYQIKKIVGVKYEQEGKFITFKETGTAKIYYYKYPKRINADTKEDEYKFEVDPEVLEIAKMGVAADILKMDVSNQYGRIWDNEYQRLLQTLDPRKTSGTVIIGSGVNI